MGIGHGDLGDRTGLTVLVQFSAHRVHGLPRRILDDSVGR
jgi:hypothetical protein